MKYFAKERKVISVTILGIFFAGIVTGIIFFCVFREPIIHFTMPLLLKAIYWTQYLDQESKDYFFYLFRQRIKNGMSVILCTVVWNYRFAAYLTCALIGFLIGCFVCLCVTQYGAAGIFLSLFFYFPHILIYLSALALWGRLQKKELKGIGTIHETGYNKWVKQTKIVQYLIILMVTIIGIGIEYYVNIIILKKIIKFFSVIEHNI